MNKPVRTIVVILLAFALASLSLYWSRMGGVAPAPQQSDPARPIISEIKIAEGQISAVDQGSKTLILIDGSGEVVFAFDERTAIVESGRAIQPGSIQRGAAATVRYTQRGGKNWARKIELARAAPPESY
ncbi:MAG TPA: hypothetical protein VF762_09465 [Blastocatellia bacterium]